MWHKFRRTKIRTIRLPLTNEMPPKIGPQPKPISKIKIIRPTLRALLRTIHWHQSMKLLQSFSKNAT